MNQQELNDISKAAADFATDQVSGIAGKHLDAFDVIYELKRKLLMSERNIIEIRESFKKQIERAHAEKTDRINHALAAQADTISHYTDTINELKKQVEQLKRQVR